MFLYCPNFRTNELKVWTVLSTEDILLLLWAIRRSQPAYPRPPQETGFLQGCPRLPAWRKTRHRPGKIHPPAATQTKTLLFHHYCPISMLTLKAQSHVSSCKGGRQKKIQRKVPRRSSTARQGISFRGICSWETSQAHRRHTPVTRPSWLSWRKLYNTFSIFQYAIFRTNVIQFKLDISLPS